MEDECVPTINLEELFNIGGLGSSMQDEIQELNWQLYRIPSWRKIKRYRLFEKIDKLESDYALMDHVFNDH